MTMQIRTIQRIASIPLITLLATLRSSSERERSRNMRARRHNLHAWRTLAKSEPGSSTDNAGENTKMSITAMPTRSKSKMFLAESFKDMKKCHL